MLAEVRDFMLRSVGPEDEEEGDEGSMAQDGEKSHERSGGVKGREGEQREKKISQFKTTEDRS